MLISDLSSDVCSSDLERGVTHRQPHHQCEGESAVDQNLPEFARPCGFDVQIKRLRTVGERGHQQIMGLGDRAADFMLDTLADGPFVEVFSSHQFSSPVILARSVPSLTLSPTPGAWLPPRPSKGTMLVCSLLIPSTTSRP